MRDYARIAAVCVLAFGTSLGTWASADEPKRPLAGGAEKSPDIKKVPGEIMVLHATNSGGGIDKELRHLKQLQKPPFSSYDTYRLLQRHPLLLRAQTPAKTALPNGRVLQTVLKEILGDRYRVAASISPRGNKKGKYLPLLEVTAKKGEVFFVAGQSYRQGILVVGIRVGTQTKPEKKPYKPAPKR
ncbi:MAG: hypothetical protein CSA75_02510 [Sorangium cellulosum]|nr:MAG: hypothetical protein CSA75_02510 [Sorangium cellulosum]